MASLVGCCACSAASCLGNTACSCFGKATKHSNKLTRAAYTAVFFLVSLGAWAWFSWGYDWYIKAFPHSALRLNCPHEICFGAMSVYRITMVLTIFFLVHWMMSLVCRKSSPNAKWWGLKLILLAGGIVAVFFIPNPFFTGWAWVALFGAALFLLFQLVLLVDFAHSWSESWVRKWDEDPTKIKWYYGLIAASVVLYIVALTLTGLEYGLFSIGSEHCRSNAIFITVNLLLSLLGTGLSLHPKVQEKNPNSGLLQSAIVSAYTAYLIWSALMSEPDHSCNHLTGGKESFSALSGAIVVFISTCYSAFRVSGKSDTLWSSKTRHVPTVTVTSPLTTANLEEGNQSILDTTTDADPDGEVVDEEMTDEGPYTYNYTFFHFCFALASCYVAMLITNWMIVQPPSGSDKDYVIGRSIASMWVKVVCSWLAHLLYLWSLTVPVMFPDRQFY